MLKKTANFTENPKKILEYLDFLSKFYNYSPRNKSLIISQRRDAVAVGSFAFFKKQGYSVLKGEKALQIIVPKTVQFFERKGKIIKLSEATKQEKEEIRNGNIRTRSKTFFSLGSVFDITQTNVPKEMYPELFPNKHEDFTLKDPSSEKYYKVLKPFDFDKRMHNLQYSINKLSKEINVKIIKHLPNNELGMYSNVKGFYDREKNFIYLNPKNTPTENIKTSIHEIAHSLLHGKDTSEKRNFLDKNSNFSQYFKNNSPTAIKELQAEMIAYTVCKEYGIDTQKYSERYIANWTNNNQKLNELEPIKQQEVFEGISGIAMILDNHLLSSLKQIRFKEINQEQDKEIEKILEQDRWTLKENKVEKTAELKREGDPNKYILRFENATWTTKNATNLNKISDKTLNEKDSDNKKWVIETIYPDKTSIKVAYSHNYRETILDFLYYENEFEPIIQKVKQDKMHNLKQERNKEVKQNKKDRDKEINEELKKLKSRGNIINTLTHTRNTRSR